MFEQLPHIPVDGVALAAMHCPHIMGVAHVASILFADWHCMHFRIAWSRLKAWHV